jgi:hypothetical protein
MRKLVEARAAAVEAICLEPKNSIGSIARPTAAFKSPKTINTTSMGLRKAGLPN